MASAGAADAEGGFGSRFRGAEPTIQRIQDSLRRMAADITKLLDSKDGHGLLITQIVTGHQKSASGAKKVAYLDMRRVNNGTLGLELSQARTVQIHGIDCSNTCLQITNVLMDSDGTSSPAMAAGLKKGDVITRVGREALTSIDALLQNVRDAQKTKMQFLVLEYCRLPRFGFLQRDIESARAEIEDKCYQTRLQAMLEQHVNHDALRNLSPAELYALFPSPFSRSGGSILPDTKQGGLGWSGRIVQTHPVVSGRTFLQFRGEGEVDPWQQQQQQHGRQRGQSGSGRSTPTRAWSPRTSLGSQLPPPPQPMSGRMRAASNTSTGSLRQRALSNASDGSARQRAFSNASDGSGGLAARGGAPSGRGGIIRRADSFSRF